jgi:hypothetical protein
MGVHVIVHVMGVHVIDVMVDKLLKGIFEPTNVRVSGINQHISELTEL